MNDHVRHASDESFLASGGLYLPELGNRVIQFIERHLVLEDGKPFILLPWEKEVIHSWYSWVHPDRTTRRVKTGLLHVARKNGKSALTFALTMWHLIHDGEGSASCVSCAVDREQAAQIYDWCDFAIEHNRYLKAALYRVKSKKLIEYPNKHSKYRSISRESKSAYGHGHSFIIHDELAMQPKDDLYISLKNSTDAKPNGLQLITSSSGWNKNGIYFKLLDYSRKVMRGEVIDHSFQPWLFEIPEGANLDDETLWPLANPSLGTTRSVEDFRAEWNAAKQIDTLKASFIRLKFNQFTEAENSWIDPTEWDACKGTFDGLEAIASCDVGATRDLTAISLVFALPNKTYGIKTWGFVPEGALQTRDSTNNVIYQMCQHDGSLTVTKGTATNIEFIISKLDELRAKYRIKAVVFDQWQSLPLSNHCEKQGIKVVNFPQYHRWYNGPCIELERLVKAKKIIHDGSSLLRWQIGHTYLSRDSKGYVKPETARPENKKDNLIAVCMALSEALQQPGEAKKSVYESRGLISI